MGSNNFTYTVASQSAMDMDMDMCIEGQVLYQYNMYVFIHSYMRSRMELAKHVRFRWKEIRQRERCRRYEKI